MALLSRTKRINFDRTYKASASQVWQAWTDPDLLRQWWGPENTIVTDCEVDLQIGGEVRIVMEAGEKMGKYQGTRWPMAGTFTDIEPETLLRYDARSWTEGEEAGTTIEHINEVVITPAGDETQLRLTISINKIGPKAKMAAFGMKWGYKAQLKQLEELLAQA